MKRKVIYPILILLIVGFGYSLYVISTYNIEDNKKAMESSLKKWLNRGEEKELNPHLIDVVQLGNSSTYIGLFQYKNEKIGYAQLIQGINKRFKITTGGYGDNSIRYQKIETNKGMYLILAGKNPGLKIDQIEASIGYDSFHFTTDVSNDAMFVKYKKLPQNIENPYYAELTYYDKDKNIIQIQ